MRATKPQSIKFAIGVAGFILSCLIQASSFGYFLGQLRQEVRDLSSRIERMEKVLDTKTASAQR
jgi:hypothetical protein